MLRLMPMKRMQEALIKPEDVFDRFFDDFFSPFEVMNSRFNSFKVDVSENDNEYLIEADLPGFNKEDLSLTYENNYLTISAKKQDAKEVKNDQFIRRERQFGELRRTFYIENINLDDVDAKFENGLLEVTLKKTEKPKNQKQIEIK